MMFDVINMLSSGFNNVWRSLYFHFIDFFEEGLFFLERVEEHYFWKNHCVNNSHHKNNPIIKA